MPNLATDMYLEFRQELDKMCVPVILDNLECNEYIIYNGKTVGMVCGNPNYIDCVYILPKYRRKGLAKKAVLEWYARYCNFYIPVRLHIINNNTTALKFWHSLFVLQVVERNPVDTLYEIVCIKKE